ncbi:hypothetical protein P2H44_23235 [Albimonas sp. CAU 1670]|uniref:hypothetical protein n=1 Tax=Albimonas sp. CAU 1670 TaxID=3032599 RepID=UPI0023DAE132|nr:hypothetical protein [Albimonas sp. CAU 1670]MDF2235481.1 hypothetical protein [Albimonas sp. CAU 1670]
MKHAWLVAPVAIAASLWGAAAQATIVTTLITESDWGPGAVATSFDDSGFGTPSAAQDLSDGLAAPGYLVSQYDAGYVVGVHRLPDESLGLGGRRVVDFEFTIDFRFLDGLYASLEEAALQEVGFYLEQDGHGWGYTGNLAGISGVYNDGSWHRFQAGGLTAASFTRFYGIGADPFATLSLEAGAAPLSFGFYTYTDGSWVGATAIYDNLQIRARTEAVPLPGAAGLLALGCAALAGAGRAAAVRRSIRRRGRTILAAAGPRPRA